MTRSEQCPMTMAIPWATNVFSEIFLVNENISNVQLHIIISSRIFVILSKSQSSLCSTQSILPAESSPLIVSHPTFVCQSTLEFHSVGDLTPSHLKTGVNFVPILIDYTTLYHCNSTVHTQQSKKINRRFLCRFSLPKAWPYPGVLSSPMLFFQFYY